MKIYLSKDIIQPEKVFKNIDHYKKVTLTVLSALSNKNSKKRTQDNISFLLSRIVVEFSPKYKETNVRLDWLEGIVVIEARKRRNESNESLEERRIGYLALFLKSIESMKTNAIASIYLVIKEEGRKELEVIPRSKKGKK